MGKIRSGILGQLRGKVAGVVGGQWKDVNYVREYIKPANPNTAAQQTQRGKFGRAVAFAKPLVGPVFNSYTDRFLKSLSGFNQFIKTNIALFLEAPTFEEMVLTSGTLSVPTMGDVAATFANDTVLVKWSTSLGANGLATDKIYIAVYNETVGNWGFAAAETVRSEGAAGEPVDLVMAVDDVVSAWVWAIRKEANIITILSTSSYGTDVAA